MTCFHKVIRKSVFVQVSPHSTIRATRAPNNLGNEHQYIQMVQTVKAKYTFILSKKKKREKEGPMQMGRTRKRTFHKDIYLSSSNSPGPLMIRLIKQQLRLDVVLINLAEPRSVITGRTARK